MLVHSMFISCISDATAASRSVVDGVTVGIHDMLMSSGRRYIVGPHGVDDAPRVQTDAGRRLRPQRMRNK